MIYHPLHRWIKVYAIAMAILFVYGLAMGWLLHSRPRFSVPGTHTIKLKTNTYQFSERYDRSITSWDTVRQNLITVRRTDTGEVIPLQLRSTPINYIDFRSSQEFWIKYEPLALPKGTYEITMIRVDASRRAFLDLSPQDVPEYWLCAVGVVGILLMIVVASFLLVLLPPRSQAYKEEVAYAIENIPQWPQSWP